MNDQSAPLASPRSLLPLLSSLSSSYLLLSCSDHRSCKRSSRVLRHEGVKMQPSGSIIVHGKEGWHGTGVPASPSSQSDASQILVQLNTGQQLLVAAEALVQQQDGSYYLPLTLEELEPYRLRPRSEAGNTTVIPIIEEELDVQKRVVETAKVRVTKG